VRLASLDRDALAPLEPSALQDEAAGPGHHTFHETMDALTSLFLWLVRSLRHNSGILR